MSDANDLLREKSDSELLKIDLNEIGKEIKDLKKYWNILTYLDRKDVLESALDVLNKWKEYKIPSEIKPKFDNLYEGAYILYKSNNENKPAILDRFLAKLSKVKNEPEIPRARIVAQYILIIPKLPLDVRNDFERYFGIDKDLEKYGRKLVVYEKLLIEGGTQARYYAVSHCLLKLYEIYFRNG